MPSKKNPIAPAANGDFESLVTNVVQIHHQAQDFAAKAVNIGLTLRNWLIGWQIEEYQRNGADRASYGDKLMDTLAKRLIQQGWKRCDRRELYRFRQLYPPDLQDEAVKTVLAQANLLCAEWAV